MSIRNKFETRKKIKGQLSLEFLFVMGAYILFIFILVSALKYSRYLQNIEEQEFSMRVNSLKLIETQRLTNNKFTDMNVFVEGCSITRGTANESIICKKENITKIVTVPMKDAGIFSFVVYKPLT